MAEKESYLEGDNGFLEIRLEALIQFYSLGSFLVDA